MKYEFITLQIQSWARIQKQSKVTQQELANKAGISLNSLNKLFKGKTYPRLKNMNKIFLAMKSFDLI